MKKIKLLFAIGVIMLLIAACKKSSNNPSTPYRPASSTQWTYNNITYNGIPAQWIYDTTGMVGYLSSEDSTGTNAIAVAFPLSDPSARPAAGKYFFVNSNGTNIPSGANLSQICILEVGPSTNLGYSIGGTLTDTAIVTYNNSNKAVVFFSNISVTGNKKVSGTLVE